jgi:hypothetical protein
MIDRRNTLLIELESLQTRRRDAVEAYVSTGDRNCWREVREASQAIAGKLQELEEVGRPSEKQLGQQAQPARNKADAARPLDTLQPIE